jgi:hypothetical protein
MIGPGAPQGDERRHDAAIVARRKSGHVQGNGVSILVPSIEEEQAEGERRFPMEILLIIVILILLFGGGLGLYRR